MLGATAGFTCAVQAVRCRRRSSGSGRRRCSQGRSRGCRCSPRRCRAGSASRLRIRCSGSRRRSPQASFRLEVLLVPAPLAVVVVFRRRHRRNRDFRRFEHRQFRRRRDRRRRPQRFRDRRGRHRRRRRRGRCRRRRGADGRTRDRGRSVRAFAQRRVAGAGGAQGEHGGRAEDHSCRAPARRADVAAGTGAALQAPVLAGGHRRSAFGAAAHGRRDRGRRARGGLRAGAGGASWAVSACAGGRGVGDHGGHRIRF